MGPDGLSLFKILRHSCNLSERLWIMCSMKKVAMLKRSCAGRHDPPCHQPPNLITSGGYHLPTHPYSIATINTPRRPRRGTVLHITLWTLAVVSIALAQTQAPLSQATYFNYRLQHLNQALKLTPDQERKIVHVVEQETGELNEFICDPAISRKDQLAKFDAVLRQSDANMKPILTPEQYKQLPTIREAEMKKLESLKPPRTCSDAYWKLNQ